MLDRLPDLDPAAISGVLNSTLMLPAFLAMLIPFSWRARRSWVPWGIGLFIALLFSGLLGAGTLFLSSLPATTGKGSAIGPASHFLLFKAGFFWILIAPLAPFAGSLLLYATEAVWCRVVRHAALRWGVVVTVVAASAVAPAIGMALTAGVAAKASEPPQGGGRPLPDLRGGVSDQASRVPGPIRGGRAAATNFLADAMRHL